MTWMEKLSKIPADELKKQMDEIREEYNDDLASMIAAEAYEEGRGGLVHRELRDFVSFVGNCIFGEVDLENFREATKDTIRSDDRTTLLEYMALYMIPLCDEEEDES